MHDHLKTIIKQTTIESIINYFKKNLKRKRNFQILDLLIPRERNIRSIVGGLETSMGKTLWEPLAKEIAKQNGFVVVNKNLDAPINMPGSLSSTLQIVIEARENQNGLYDAKTSHDAIKSICQQFINSPISNFKKPPRGNGVDVWLQKNGVDYFFDTKTVQPNVGALKSFLTQILHWYAYYYSRYPTGTGIGRIIFPYNPYPGDYWKYCKAHGKPLEKKEEAWVENEFWDFISGVQNTYDLIKESFVELYDEKTLETELSNLFKIQ